MNFSEKLDFNSDVGEERKVNTEFKRNERMRR